MTARELLELHPYCIAACSTFGFSGRIIGFSTEEKNLIATNVPLEYAIILETSQFEKFDTRLTGFTVLPNVNVGRWADSRRIILMSHSDQCAGGGKKSVVPTRFPHKCPACGGNAYIGFTNVEHERGRCEKR